MSLSKSFTGAPNVQALKLSTVKSTPCLTFKLNIQNQIVNLYQLFIFEFYILKSNSNQLLRARFLADRAQFPNFLSILTTLPATAYAIADRTKMRFFYALTFCFEDMCLHAIHKLGFQHFFSYFFAAANQVLYYHGSAVNDFQILVSQSVE